MDLINLKLLFIRFSSLGDILLTFPAISFLKYTYPDIIIHFVSKSQFQDILKLNQFIDEVILFDDKNDSISKLKKIIKHNNYDYIIDLHNNIRSRILTLFLPFRLVRFKKHSIKKFLLVKTKINLLKNYPNIIKRYFLTFNKIVELDENNFDTYLETYKINVSDYEKFVDLEKLIQIDNNELIGFAPSAKHKTKILPLNKFAKIGRELLTNHKIIIILFGSKDEFQYCEKLRFAIGSDRCVNMAGKTNLIETSLLLNKCKLIIANDTGLMHLGDLLKVPLIAIFGSTVKELGFFPSGKASFVVENKGLNCRPCSHIGLNECPKKHFKCMNDIDESVIIKKANEILNNNITLEE